jgi:hypothetical protein
MLQEHKQRVSAQCTCVGRPFGSSLYANPQQALILVCPILHDYSQLVATLFTCNDVPAQASSTGSACTSGVSGDSACV